MALIYFTDAQTGNQIAVNPTYVVVVFTTKGEDGVEKTVVNTTTGNVVVNASQIEVVGQLQAQLQ
jgi:hypothetical protein